MPQPANLGSAPGDGQGKERKLESWGEIAAYLRREIRTVQRWEKTLGLPIHRLQVGKQSSVYAYPSELDKWYREREPREIETKDDDSSSELLPSAVHEPNGALGPAPGRNGASSVLLPSKIPFYKMKTAWFGSVAFVIMLGILLWRSPGWPFADTKLRLFVRPLQNISGDPGQAEFTEELTNELNTMIGKLDPAHLGVIAPTSSKQLGAKSVPELASLVRVNYVLEGSVYRANNQVRINVSLISVKDQTPLWSDSYTENLSDILKVQDKVAETVAQKLSLNLPPPAPASSPATVDPEGYNSYLRGRHYWANRDLSSSIPAFQDAVKKLPQYAPAHAGLASAYVLMGEAPNDAVAQTVSAPQAKAEAEIALKLDPKSAEAHYVLGNVAMYYDWDFPAAESRLREAIRLEPNNATAHQWLGQYFMTQNRLSEARSETLKALELDPVSLPIFTTAQAEMFYYAHDFDSTIAQAKFTLEQSPNFLLGELWLASAYREKKMYPEAIQHFRAACSLAPGNPALLSLLGHALAISGDRTAALDDLNQLKTLSHQRYVPSLYLAVVSIGLGDKENAFMYFNRAVDEHDDRLIYLAVEPIADSLRSDARFQTLLRRVHLDNSKP
jgi:TolB-like protein/Flp pilus assembly protein TadD